jgi:hypothetical protein
MQDDNMGHPAANDEAAKVTTKPLSPILEAGVSSKGLTSKRPQSLTPIGVDRASGSERSCTFEASEFESSTKVQVEGTDWKVREKLARLKGDLKGKPFKAVVDLIPHGDMKMKRDISAQGMGENMIYFHMCVSIST